MADLLTATQAAKMLGFKPRYVQVLASSGRIEATRLGTDWRFTEEAISAFRASKRKVGRPAKAAQSP